MRVEFAATTSRARVARIMNLDDAQRKKVAEWIAQGLKLSEIQGRLGSELGVQLTYMEVRLLVDDLKLTPKDAERPKAAVVSLPASVSGSPAANVGTSAVPPAAGKPGNISVQMDQIARPGAMV